MRASLWRTGLEELVAYGAADDELFIRVATTRRWVDDPVRAPHEAQVFPKVLSERGEAGERDAVPETAATSALEESLANNARDGAI
jgi:hypothetical protein